jgi:hypothetical protein
MRVPIYRINHILPSFVSMILSRSLVFDRLSGEKGSFFLYLLLNVVVVVFLHCSLLQRRQTSLFYYSTVRLNTVLQNILLPVVAHQRFFESVGTGVEGTG